VGISIGDIVAGIFGVVGSQAAVIERQRTGCGKHVDISMLDAQVALLENAVVRYQLDGEVPAPIGSRHPSITPFGVFRAKNGYLVIAAGNNRHFALLCDTLGLSDLQHDGRFDTNSSRCKNHVALKQLIEFPLASRPVEEWLAILESAGLACGPLNDISSVINDPQLASRGMFVQLPIADGLDLKTVASPIKFEGVEPSYVSAPSLDQHREALLRELGL
jgi:CoA:oxalate CoA-transferase